MGSRSSSAFALDAENRSATEDDLRDGERNAIRDSLWRRAGGKAWRCWREASEGDALRITQRGICSAAAGGGDPVEEALHTGAFTPEERKEFMGVEIRGFVAEESFHAPLNVWRGPRTQPVALGDDPVVAEGVQHGAQRLTSCTSG